jgi:predicted DCC family thiol-disulfide oxidoreductase YuxK
MEMKLILPDDSMLGGYRAVAYLFRLVGYTAWLGYVMEWPGIRRLSDLAYQWVARNRTCMGDVCTLHPGDLRRHHGVTTFFEGP